MTRLEPVLPVEPERARETGWAGAERASGGSWGKGGGAEEKAAVRRRSREAAEAQSAWQVAAERARELSSWTNWATSWAKATRAACKEAASCGEAASSARLPDTVSTTVDSSWMISTAWDCADSNDDSSS